MGNSRPLKAAGGLVWREEAGSLLVAVVHRDRYDDWSLPKGKPEAGETSLRTALREVGEETGSDVAISRRLGEVRYRVDGGAKVVRFWAMRHLAGEFAPSDEVDALVWLEADRARRLLSYPGDRKMVDRLTVATAPTSTLVLVRHAKAGKRSEWNGPDALRPLERSGRMRAKALADLLSPFAPTRIVSADPLRCVQTIEPLATNLDLAIDIDRAFSDVVCDRDVRVSRRALAQLVKSGRVAAVCSQGDTLSALIGSPTAKGAAWVLGCRGDRISADYYRARGRVHVPA